MSRYTLLIFFVLLVSNASANNCTKNWFHKVTILNKEQASDYDLFEANVLDLKNDTIIAVLNAEIPVLCEGAIRGLPLLENLQLSRLGILEIQPHPFSHLPSLKKLFLKQNNITNITSGIFNGMAIEYLDLSLNRIGHIDQFAFDNMHSLVAVDLEGNKLKKLNPKWFFDCPNLYSISFRRNLIKEIPYQAFRYLEEDNKETFIYLQENKISKIASRAFVHFKKQVTINFEDNKLYAIPSDIFENSNNTMSVILSKNKFSCISEDTLNMFVKTCEYVSLEDNPLSCDCKKRLGEYSEYYFEYLDLAYENDEKC